PLSSTLPQPDTSASRLHNSPAEHDSAVACISWLRIRNSTTSSRVCMAASGCPSLGLWMPATPPRFPRPLGDWSETNLRSVGQPYGRGFRELQLLSALILPRLAAVRP